MLMWKGKFKKKPQMQFNLNIDFQMHFEYDNFQIVDKNTL